MNKSSILKILINTVIGVVLILIWLQFVDINQIIGAILKANFVLLLPAFLFMFLSLFVRSVRLKIFLAPVKKVSLKDLTLLNGVGIMLNFLIPIRAGEVAKGLYLNTQYGLPLGKSIIWIFLDRFIDFMMVLVMASVLLFVVPTKLNETFTLTLTVIALGVIMITYLMIYQVDFTKKLIKFLKPLLIINIIKIYFDRFTNFFLDTFSILKRSPLDITKFAFLSFLSYIADALIWYFTFLSLGYPQQFPKMFLGQVLSALTYLVPAAPGYVGSAEASGSLILSGVFDVPVNIASAMVVLFHMASAIYIILFGIISLYGIKIDLSLIFNKALKREK
ncbi:flippase-like domain-containing protein [Candidatus Daviesbacteria bacterium]|nr:flippase-like domain-containing protein [Candidatus Daviesbacteria bacterium]